MTATIDSGPGLQSSMATEGNPVISNTSMFSQPHVWAWIWFITAVLVILGFHIRIFGAPIPPAANFP